MSTQMLEVPLLGVGTVLRLESDAWSVVKRLRQATNDYPPPRAPWRTQVLPDRCKPHVLRPGFSRDVRVCGLNIMADHA